MQFLGEGGGVWGREGWGLRKKQDIVGLPKSGELRQFADLKGS